VVEQERLAQAGLLHDIFGPRPMPCLPLLDSLIEGLADAAYQERSLPDGHLDRLRLAVVADALLCG
jgi:hypothetical protein